MVGKAEGGGTIGDKVTVAATVMVVMFLMMLFMSRIAFASCEEAFQRCELSAEQDRNDRNFNCDKSASENKLGNAVLCGLGCATVAWWFNTLTGGGFCMAICSATNASASESSSSSHLWCSILRRFSIHGSFLSFIHNTFASSGGGDHPAASSWRIESS